MKTTITVLFLLAVLVSSTQTFRHVYVKWIEPRSSVLDEFRDEVDSNITETESLDELVTLYRNATNEVERYESNLDNPKIDHSKRRHAEPYETQIKIEREISNREFDANQLFKLKLYWACGFVSLLLGIFSFIRVNQWLGLAGVIVGFSEMLFWTSPLFHNRLHSQQFEHLLNYKLLFSVIAWVLLIGLWLLIENRGVFNEQEVKRKG